jgi:malyl-CoA/(S)-citramalyl-CoA lyase
MQGLSLGPADLAADRRMKTTRVGGGHPGYLVREDPPRVDGAPTSRRGRATYQQDLWHYTIARMVDACAMHGIYPYYGPFGDISRRGRLRGPVPQRLPARAASARGRCTRSRSRSPTGCSARASRTSGTPRRVVAAMGDGTGAVMLDGKMEDDASLKQCLVLVALAEQLAERDPDLKKLYDGIEA